jgi:hypothetical protein
MRKAPLSLFERVHYECSNEILCIHCFAPLDRHQPVESTPERLLGTCCECGAWFLIDEEEQVIVVLPDLWSASE